MTTHQLELMRQEIEEMVSGLAMDMVGRNTLNLSAQDYFRFQLLWQNFPQLCSAVTDILERPSQQAARNWQVVPPGLRQANRPSEHQLAGKTSGTHGPQRSQVHPLREEHCAVRSAGEPLAGRLFGPNHRFSGQGCSQGQRQKQPG